MVNTFMVVVALLVICLAVFGGVITLVTDRAGAVEVLAILVFIYVAFILGILLVKGHIFLS